jgi:hypothetical protein
VSFQGPPNSNKEVLELYQSLEQWFTRMDRKVVALTLSARYSWTVKLDDGMIFELGRELNSKDRKQIHDRLELFFQYWPEIQKRLPNPVEYVDLRYAHGFSVRTGPRSDSRLSEMKLAGLNQKISIPADENIQENISSKEDGEKNLQTLNNEKSNLEKLNKRVVKRVKQSNQMESKVP